MPTRERVGIGVVGGGMMSQVGHLPFYLADRRCNVVAVAETRPSLVRALRERHPSLRVVGDHREFLADPAISAVVIVAPRPAMGPLALEALQAGKSVMMEKPMAHTAAQAACLVEAARAAGVALAVGFMKRHDPGVEAARRLLGGLLADGRLGRLALARFYNFAKSYAVPPPPHTRPVESRTERFAEWPLWPDWLPERHRETYAWFINSASHDVNLMHFFFPGRIEVLSAASPSPDAMVATLRTGAVPIAFEVAKSAPGRWLEGAEFLFEKGRLAVDIPSPMATGRVARVTLDDAADVAERTVPEIASGWAFERQAASFVDVLTGTAAPLTDGEDGLADLELCERLWRRVTEPTADV